MDLLPLAVFLAGLCIGAPVAIALGAGALVFFAFAGGVPAEAFVQKLQSSFGSFPLLAIPLFVLSAALLNLSGVSQRLFELVDTLVGRSVGGLGKANILLATLMGGVSASAAADAAMQAKLVGMPMVERGYPRPFVSATIATASIITPIIPPGIGFILYGAMTETSIGRLFAAGVVPGLLLCAALMFTVHLVAKRHGYGAAAAASAAARGSFPSRLMKAMRRAALALLMPFFIVFGIRYGFFTPTEAGAILVVIALAYGVVVYRQLSLRDIGKAIHETVEATASLMLIVAFATAFAFYLTWEGIPQEILRFLLGRIGEPLLVLLILNLVLLVAGMFLDTVSAMIILVPIIHPIALRIGIDPVHIGLIVVLNLTMGGVTPPVGLLMYLSNAIIGCTVGEFTRAAWPFLVALVTVLALVVLFPALSLTIPNALFG
jgi:tripartite ATP-independent transporter DctM subunit